MTLMERGGAAEDRGHSQGRGAPLPPLSWWLPANVNQMVESATRVLIDCRADGAVSSPPAMTPG